MKSDIKLTSSTIHHLFFGILTSNKQAYITKSVYIYMCVCVCGKNYYNCKLPVAKKGMQMDDKLLFLG